jgi:hypothetical protein
MNIPVSQQRIVRTTNVSACLECTLKRGCPQEPQSSLPETSNMKLTAKPLAALIFVILFGWIGLTTALGWWQTKTTKEPVKFAEGIAGQYDPADIRGSYLFGDISRLFEIPLATCEPRSACRKTLTRKLMQSSRWKNNTPGSQSRSGPRRFAFSWLSTGVCLSVAKTSTCRKRR